MLEINSISVIIYLYSGNDKIMEVVSTSNLVSSENVKKKKNSYEFFCYTTWLAKWEPMHICKHQAIRSFIMAELWNSALRNTYTQKSKIKTDQQ